MTNYIFSGTDKEFFNNLTLDSVIDAKWLAIDELVNTDNDFKNTKFVLFYSAPEAFFMSECTGILNSLDSIEQQWQPQIELLTQFYLNNIKQSLLVEHEHCKANTIGFLTRLESKLALKKESCQITESLGQISLYEKISKQVKKLCIISELKENYSVQDSYENIVSAADLLTPDCDTSIEHREAECINNYQQTLAKIQQSQEELAELTSVNELSLLQIHQLQEELETLFIENKQLKEKVTIQTSKVNSNEELNDNELSELKTENEIALLQIHQLQEELEFYFIKYQSLSNNRFIKNKTAVNIADKRFEKSLNLAKLLTA